MLGLGKSLGPSATAGRRADEQLTQGVHGGLVCHALTLGGRNAEGVFVQLAAACTDMKNSLATSSDVKSSVPLGGSSGSQAAGLEELDRDVGVARPGEGANDQADENQHWYSHPEPKGPEAEDVDQQAGEGVDLADL